MSGSQSSLRDANRTLIVEAIKRYGNLTQVELAAATGLSPTTVSTIVRSLAEFGVVETRTTVRSGRRAQQVLLARRVGLAIGVHVGHRQLRILLGDFAEEVVAQQTLPLPRDHRVDTTLDQAALLVGEVVEQVGANLEDVVGIGVALPAPVDAATGMISVRGLMPGWDDVHVGQVLAKRLGRPVYVDNDANLGALGELTRGAGRDLRDLVYVGASHGTGAGLVINGSLHRGVAGTAGEIGHVQVDPQGLICRCGSRGCLDTVAGAGPLLAALRASHGTLTLRDVVRRANEGDPGCARVVADAGAVIGSVVAGLGVAVNPQAIIVGGELAATGEILLAPLRDAVGRGILPNLVMPVRVVPAELGQRAEATGALALVRQETDVPVNAPIAADDAVVEPRPPAGGGAGARIRVPDSEREV